MSYLWLVMAGVWSMDRVTAFNFMISRPMVVSAFMGLVTGHFYWCIAGGFFFEIVGLIDIPVGTRLSLDDTFGAFAYCYAICYTSQTLTYEAALLAAAIAFMVMYPVGFSSHLARWINKQLFRRYKDTNREWLLIFFGQVLAFTRGLVVYTVGALLVYFAFELTLRFVGLSFVQPPDLIALGAIIAGYFMGFFHTRRGLKAALFVAGALISWVLM